MNAIKLQLNQYKYFLFLGLSGGFFMKYSRENMNLMVPHAASFLGVLGLYHGKDTPLVRQGYEWKRD